MGRKTHTLIFPFELILPRTEHPLALLIIKKAREPLVSCPDPALTRREKGLVTIEACISDFQLFIPTLFVRLNVNTWPQSQHNLCICVCVCLLDRNLKNARFSNKIEGTNRHESKYILRIDV